MKINMKFIIILFVSIGISQGQLSANWPSDILEGVNKLNEKIHGDVAQLNKQIQETVKGRLAQVDRLNQELAERVGKIPEELRNLPDNAHTIVLNTNAGASRSVISGTGPDGEPYFRDSEDKVIDGILHHSERVYNPKTKTMNEYKYTLDLKDPKAKPVPVKE